MALLSQRKMVIADGIVWAILDGEAVVLNATTGVYFGLNGPGTVAWQLLANGAGDDEMFAGLLAEYEVDSVQLRGDLALFRESLWAKKLVRCAEG